MALHRSIIRQGTSLLDKQAIKTLRTFRLAVLKEGSDLAVFTHPATLSRLALWVVDALRDLVTAGGLGDAVARRKKGLPLVVACLDERRDSFLVVGVSGAAEYGDVRKKCVCAVATALTSAAASTSHSRSPPRRRAPRSASIGSTRASSRCREKTCPCTSTSCSCPRPLILSLLSPSPP